MKIKIQLTLFLLLCILPATIASNIVKDSVKVDIYGFIRNDFYMDTYKGIGAAKEQFYLLPNFVGFDKKGNDINKMVKTNIIPIITRFGFKISGPEMFNAKTSAVIETDFLGLSNALPSVLRIRLAYLKLDWQKSSLVMGQDWHPFFTLNCFAKMVGINTGAPFNPFSRTPMVRYTQTVGKFNFTGAALYELQYPTLGPVGATSDYQQNAVIPELVGGIEFNKNGFKLGGMVQLKTIKPRIMTDSMIVTNQLVSGLNYMVYAQYAKNKLEINAKSTFGGLMSHMIMPGGFGVSGYNPKTGQESYTPINYYTSYINFIYGHKFKVGGYLSYGVKTNVANSLYDFSDDGSKEVRQWGRFLDVNDMYRASIMGVYTIKNILLMIELERTTANYGQGEMNLENGRYSEVHKTTNNRINLSVMYRF